MQEYDRLVEFINPSSDPEKVIYFHQEKGVFINKIPNDYVPLRKDILLGSVLTGRELIDNEIYPTGTSYMLCKTDQFFSEIRMGDLSNLRILEIERNDEADLYYPGEKLFYAIRTPSKDNNCLVYSIVLSHPKMNKNLKSDYINKLKERLIEYCLLRFTETYEERKKEIDELAAKEIDMYLTRSDFNVKFDIDNMMHKHRVSQYISGKFIPNSKIPEDLKNRDSILGYYLEQIPDDNYDYVFTENLFDICKNKYADSLLLGEYIAEFFKINIVYYVDPRNEDNEDANIYRVEYIKDVKWNTIYIYLEQYPGHFSNICRVVTESGGCITENIIDN